MKKAFSKYLIKAAILLLTFQVCDYIFFKYFRASINSRFVFGSVGENAVAAIIGTLLLLIFAFLIYRRKDLYLPGSLVVAGGLSNILDRFFYGGVADYFNLFFIPTFNLADIAIVAGIIYIALISAQGKSPLKIIN